jgi:RNA polymerase sigma factor (TIGR02999 family)
MSDVTQILGQIEAGDEHASEKLLPLVYEELRKLAAARLAHEQPGQTLQATALVHEAYLHLIGPTSPTPDPRFPTPSFNSRGHFFAAAAEAMRRILIMNARRRRAQKRGGDCDRIDLDPDLLPAAHRDERLLALDDSLARLEERHPEKARLVKLRFFAGLSIADAAAAMSISDATADRHWAYARAWLQRDMAGAGAAASS